MYAVRGQYQVEIRIEGRDVDLQSHPLEKLILTESVDGAVPICEIILHTDIDSTDAYDIYDGALVELGIQSLRFGDDETMQSRFRVYSIGISPRTVLDRVTLWCYYDAPDYFKDAGFEFIDGTSGTAISQIGDKSGLTVDADSSNDHQVWIRAGQTGYGFAREIANHAYRDDNSAYSLGLTQQGELRFYDVGTRRERDPSWYFISTDNLSDRLEENEIQVSGFSTRIDSGVMNRFSGYGNLMNEFDLKSGEVREPAESAVRQIQKSQDHLEINRELLSPPRYRSSPFNVGNVHDNFVKARQQNERILSTFSVNHAIVTSVRRGVNLLDRVNLDLHSRDDEQGRFRPVTSGVCYVDRIITELNQRSIQFKWNLTREGMNHREGGSLL